MTSDEDNRVHDELTTSIADRIRAIPELGDSDWDTCAMVAEVSDTRVAASVYSYTKTGLPRPIPPPDAADLLRELRQRTADPDVGGFEVAIVKLMRDPAEHMIDMLYHDAAEWRITPDNMARLGEALRPRPQDFDAPRGPWQPARSKEEKASATVQSDEDRIAAMAQLTEELTGAVLASPGLAEPRWDTFSMVGEVTDDFVATGAFSYAESGPPVPIDVPDDAADLLWELRDRTRGYDQETWDVVLVKIQRDTRQLVMNFVSGYGADMWRITPANSDHLPESMRPRAEDFAAEPPDAAPPPPVAPSATTVDKGSESQTGVATLVVEVLVDGAIRLTNLDGATGMASLQATRDWITEANRTGCAVRLCGSIGAVPAAPVVAEVRRLASSLDEAPSRPDAWPKGRSSIQTAAFSGLTEQVTDLLHRGGTPNTGFLGSTPYRLAMRHGHAEAMVALRDAGATAPRGLTPPSILPDAVVLRAYAPGWMWWLLVPFVALAALALVDGVYLLVPAILALPLIAIAVVHLILGNTACAFDGPLVARRRGSRWQGPVDMRRLDALGYTPSGTVRMPILWELGQREAGDRPDVYAKSAFDPAQREALTEIEGLRFVPLYAARGFLSPGIERAFDRYVDPSRVIIGSLAAERVWPGRAQPAAG